MMNLIKLALILVTLGACTSHKYQPKLPGVLEDSSDELLLQLIELYPPEFKALHRIVLQARGREFDFTGYLLWRRPNVFHASAFAEAGAAIFEFSNNSEGPIVQAKPKMIPEEAMVAGVMQDLLHIYQKIDRGQARLIEKEQTTRTFSLGHSETELHEYQLSKGKGLINSLGVIDGQIVREVTYATPKNFPKWPKAIPTDMKIMNYLYDYELRITVLEFTPELPNNFDQMLLTP